jgi:hypothetical protein
LVSVLSISGVAADVARHLAAAGGEAGQDDVVQVERLDQLRQVVGVVVHVVAVPGLARTAMATAVVADHAEAVVRQVEGGRFPAVGVERPAVAEDHRLAVARAPVLVIDLDAVAGGDGAGRLLDLAAGGRGLAVGADGGQRQRGGDCGGGGERAADHGGAAGWIDLLVIVAGHCSALEVDGAG